MRIAAYIAGLFTLAAFGQQAPVFRAETAGITVDVIVTDRKGHHVAGLEAADFKVFEDGVEHAVRGFTAPVAAARKRGEAAVAGGSEAVRPPQLITLLIDLGDLHPENLKQACTAASRFAGKTIDAGNSIAIYWVDTALHLALPFSRDKQKAQDVLTRLGNRLPVGRFGARERERTEMEIDDLFVRAYPETLRGAEPTPRVNEGGSASRSGKRSSEDTLELMQQEAAFRELNMLRSWLTTASALQAKTVFVALRAMALGHRDIPGRKSLVVVSEGFLHTSDAGRQMQAVTDAANRANVSIYVISAQGLAPGPSAELMAPPVPTGRRGKADFSKLGSTARSGGLNQFDWQQTMGTDPTGDFEVLARSTGGFLIKNSNDIGHELDRIEDDAGEFYSLVYYPTNHNYNGAFRSIRVELNQKGYQARYRQGYWALPPGKEVMMTPAAAQLLSRVESGEQKAAFEPMVNAALVSGANGRFSVAAAVSMPGRTVHFERSAEQFAATMNLLLVARTAKGELLAVHERYGDVRLDRPAFQEFAARRFNMQGHLPVPDLEPVSVQAIVRFSDDTVGISRREALQAAPAVGGLRITNLLLSDNIAPANCANDPLDPLCLKDRRIEIPAQRRFPTSTRLVVYCSVQGMKLDREQAPALNMTFRLAKAGKATAWEAEQVRAVKGASADALLVMALFPLERLTRGEYVLEATAEDELGRKSITERASFAVE